MRRITIILFILLGLTSCTKDDYCGVVTNGRTFITSTGTPIFILEIDGKEEYVNQKTFYDFRIGDGICLEF